MPKQPGRPRLPKGERVTDRERLTMYATQEEAKALRKMADESSLSISNYMHRAIFGWQQTKGSFGIHMEKRDDYIKYVNELYGVKFSEKDS